MMLETLLINFAMSAGSSCSFLALRSLIESKNCISPKVQEEKKSVWYNTLVSMIHSTIVTIFCVMCFFANSELWLEMMKEEKSALLRITIATSVGYFAYDFLDILHHLKFGIQWPVLAHHVIVVTEFVVLGWFFNWYNCLVVALSCEVNTIFLHLRQLFRLAKVPHDWFPFKINKHVNIVTYLFFRLATLYWMFHSALLRDRKILSSNNLWEFGLSGIILMGIINIKLFIRIVKTDYFKDEKLKKL